MIQKRVLLLDYLKRERCIFSKITLIILNCLKWKNNYLYQTRLKIGKYVNLNHVMISIWLLPGLGGLFIIIIINSPQFVKTVGDGPELFAGCE